MQRKVIRKRTHPGELIREDYMKPLKLTVTSLAENLGVSRKTLSSILKEQAGVTPDMALRLSRAFCTTPDLWLNMQRGYDLWAVENESAERQSVVPLYTPSALAREHA
ncbi:MAG: HigA family addiction module antidote protein [Desulfovibrio sp.]|jgi:addiction module HigA family antidote|nr:HigA family addiction module antidote protein [Desulfovibrio sp.]